MSYLLKYGSYIFPRGFAPAEEPSPSSVPSAKLPRADGARILLSTLSEKKIAVRGVLFRDPPSKPGAKSVRQKLDELKAALGTGPAPLYFDSDRYWRNVQKESLSFSYEGTHYGRIVTIQVDLITGDPFSYETASQQPTPTTLSGGGGTAVIGCGGNAPALPQFRLTAGASGFLAATITNTTTGEAFTLNGAVSSGDVIVVDGLTSAVTIAGLDKMALFDGLFPHLTPGVNNISVSVTSGTLASIGAVWQNRWY